MCFPFLYMFCRLSLIFGSASGSSRGISEPFRFDLFLRLTGWWLPVLRLHLRPARVRASMQQPMRCVAWLVLKPSRRLLMQEKRLQKRKPVWAWSAKLKTCCLSSLTDKVDWSRCCRRHQWLNTFRMHPISWHATFSSSMVPWLLPRNTVWIVLSLQFWLCVTFLPPTTWFWSNIACRPQPLQSLSCPATTMDQMQLTRLPWQYDWSNGPRNDLAECLDHKDHWNVWGCSEEYSPPMYKFVNFRHDADQCAAGTRVDFANAPTFEGNLMFSAPY